MRNIFRSETKFDQAKFKMLLQLSINRMNIQRTKAVAIATNTKKEIAALLRSGENEKARVRCTYLIMQDNLGETLQKMTVYVNTIRLRYEMLLSQRSCPSELKESVCALVFAAPYLQDQPELLKCREMLLSRYGKAFPNDCMECNAISPQLISRLQARSPDPALVKFYLSSIAKENQIPGWDDLDDPSMLPDLDSMPTPGATTVRDATDPLQCVAYGEGLERGMVNQPAIFTIEARDSAGNRRFVGGEDFKVYVSGPNETHIYGEVRDNGDGTYAAGYVPPLAGGYAIAIHHVATPIGTGEPYIAYIEEADLPADAGHCVAEGPGLHGGKEGEMSMFTITAFDATGKQCRVGGDKFMVYVSGPNETHIYGDVEDNNDGTYLCTYTPPVSGGYAIAIHLVDTPIGNGQPWEFFVDPKVVLPPPSAPAKKATPAPVRAMRGTFASSKSGLDASKLQKGLVIDNGTGYVKCGFAADESPIAMFPTVIGRPKFRSAMPMPGMGPVTYVGDEAKRKKGILTLQYPVDHGMIVDFNNMEAIWQHTFMNEMRIDPTEHPILLVEPVQTPAENSERCAEIMFEKFQFPGFYVSSQTALAMYSAGKTTGIVLDCGDGVCHCVPIVNGVPIKYAASRLEVAGRDVTTYITKLLAEDGIFLNSTSSERDIANDLKEKLCYVALDYESELRRQRSEIRAAYTMPDGNVSYATKARFMAPEILFNPSLVGKDTSGVSKMIIDCLEQVEEGQKAALVSNILLVGGSSQYQGFAERMSVELERLLPHSLHAHVTVPQHSQIFAWHGGAQLGADHAAFCDMCISKAQYDELGVSSLDRIRQ